MNHFLRIYVNLFLLFFGVIITNYCFAAGTVTAEKAVSIVKNKVSACGGLLQPECEPTVFNISNAEHDNGAFTHLISSAGFVLGFGAYRSQIELQFGETVPANTTTYIRLDGEESLLQSLLGGSLGDLLSNVLGSVVIGQQEIIIDARTSAGTVLSRSSIAGFDIDRVRLVSDEYGNYYVAIKPSSAYDRIRITNQTSAVAGLGKEFTLDVYHAFYYEPDSCSGEPVFTSFDGSGITLEALELNNAVENLGDAIDDDLENTFSEISLGVVGVLGTVEQMIYFTSPVKPGNEILISMATGESLLDLGLLNYVELVAYSNGTEVSSTSASSLVELDVLGLLASDEFFRFPIFDDVYAIDQIGIRVSSLLGVGLLEGSLKISGVTVEPAWPEITNIPEEGSYIICKGETETITPYNVTGGELSWYKLQAGSLVYLGQGGAYTTPDTLSAKDHEYWVRSNAASCEGEIEYSRFKLKVTEIPSAANLFLQPSGHVGIDEDNKYTYVEGVNPVTLKPTMENVVVAGEFKWYLDETMIIPISDGDVYNDVLFELDGDEITMTGLEFRDASNPYRFYLNWVPEAGCAMVQPMEVDLSSVARILNVSLQEFDAQLTINSDVLVSWKFAMDRFDQQLVVQRATDNLIFQDIWQGNLASYTDFKFLDTNPLDGESYYRLQVRNQNGEPDFSSDLRRIFIPQTNKMPFMVFPNQFDDYFSIGTNQRDVKEISYQLFSGEGSIIQEGTAKITVENPTTISRLNSLAPGKYFLIINETEVSHTYHLIKK